MPIILIILTNIFTAWFIKNKYEKIAKLAQEQSASMNDEMKKKQKENQVLKQEIADIRYKNRELEKDLAANKR